MSKVGQSGGFLGKLLGSLLKTGFPLMKNILEPLAKSLLIPLRLIASATDAAVQKKIFGCGITKLLIYVYIYIHVGQYMLFMWPSSFVFIYWLAPRKASCAQFRNYVSIYVLKILTDDSILFM